MLGPPGSDPSLYSTASIAVAITPGDTVRDVKKKLIHVSGWTDENPEDFGLFDDISEEPLKDAFSIEAALLVAVSKPQGVGIGGGRGGGRRAGAAGSGRSATIRLPSPYVEMLWAARLG